MEVIVKHFEPEELERIETSMMDRNRKYIKHWWMYLAYLGSTECQNFI